MSFLKTVNEWTEEPNDKLSKARFLSGLGREIFCLCSGGTKTLFHSCLQCIMQTGSVLLIEDPESTDMYRTLNVRQPKPVKDYNAYMGGVDKTDQLINKYNTFCKTNKWWKTLLPLSWYCACECVYLVWRFQKKACRYISELQRPDRYGQLDFTTELFRQLADPADVPLV